MDHRIAGADRADRFCYLMTLTSSGLAYLLAVTIAYRMGRTLGLTWGWSLALCASLGLATTALPYVRHVNSHIVLLGVAVPLFAGLAALTHPAARLRSCCSVLWPGLVTPSNRQPVC